MTLQECRYTTQQPRDVADNSTMVLESVQTPLAVASGSEVVFHARQVIIPTGPSQVLSLGVIDLSNLTEPTWDLGRTAVGSVFSRASVAPPVSNSPLQYFEGILQRRGRSAALDALLDYLDPLVIGEDRATLENWLQGAKVENVSAELLATVLVAVGPIRSTLKSYETFAQKVRDHLTQVEGKAAAERLLEGLI